MEEWKFWYGIFIGVALIATAYSEGWFPGRRPKVVMKDAAPRPAPSTRLLDHRGHDVEVACASCNEKVWSKHDGGEMDFNNLMPHEGHGISISCLDCGVRLWHEKMPEPTKKG